MQLSRGFFSIVAFLIASSCWADSNPLRAHDAALKRVSPDWSSSAIIEPTGRANVYEWDEATLVEKIARGQEHALHYPVSETGLLLPARPLLKILDLEPGDPLFGLVKTALSLKSDFKNFKGFWDWLGLAPYPEEAKQDYPMGVSIIRRGDVDGITLSCAACHVSQLFGKSIFGMTTRFPRANSFFAHGQSALAKIGPNTFGALTGSNREERAMYADARKHIVAIGVKKPVALGLDTSLAQVALSLAKRSQDPWATVSGQTVKNPRPNLLDHHVADSKPAVWWNTKYKTRWLSDGSVLSGNPVFTNFLWNEIGRGVDLQKLTPWIEQNSSIVEELTTAVFATTAPRWKDFFGEQSIEVVRAKRGEMLFNQNCIHCHGEYQKAWNLNPEAFATLKAKRPDLTSHDTIVVKYFAQTEVHNVGTDKGRREGMRALAEGLNPLAFSQTHQIVIEEQKGYVAPPLEGIWARYPYFHNNSIPNLCALMTAPSQRPRIYYSGPAIDRDRDYDQDCVGYPTGARTPAAWQKSVENRYDTTHEGMSNSGHYSRIFLNADQTERYTDDQKSDLIEYLKTL